MKLFKGIILLCACLFFNYTLADVLVKCDLTAEGKQIFQNSVIDHCYLDNDDYHVLWGYGIDFSTAWDDAVEACSKVYTSSSGCRAMINSCTMVQEFPISSTDNRITLEGDCDCMARDKFSNRCTVSERRSPTLYPDVWLADFTMFLANTCTTKDSFPINCKLKNIYIENAERLEISQ